MFTQARPTPDNIFRINGKRFPLATEEHLKELDARRAWDVIPSTTEGHGLGAPFHIPFSDFTDGYGFSFAGGDGHVYEMSAGWDPSAAGKLRTWPPLATLEAFTDTDYRGWIYQDYASGYVYVLRGRYAAKYAVNPVMGSVWSIIEYHVFGAAGVAVAGKPAVFDGDLYVPLVTISSGAATNWQRLSTVSATTVQQQTIVISGTPTGGTYTISFTDDATNTYTTSALAYNAPGATVQAALRLLPGLQKVTVVTTGSTPNFTHTVTMTAAPGYVATTAPHAMTHTDNTTGGTHNIANAITVAGVADQWDKGPDSYEALYFCTWVKQSVGPVLVRANNNIVDSAATNPLVGGNWGGEQTVFDSTYKITALATFRRLLYVGAPHGLFSFDETGTVIAEIPALAAIVDSQNFSGMIETNSALLCPHKLGLIRFTGSSWAIVGAEEDGHLEGEHTEGWGRPVGIAPYGRQTYVTINDPYNGVSSVAALIAQTGQNPRGAFTPHMHQLGTAALEDAAVIAQTIQPPAAQNLTTFSDDAAVGANAWSNPGNAQDNDGLAATCAIAGQTHYLKALGLIDPAIIPPTATVNGILVEVNKSKNRVSYPVGPTSPGTGANFSGVGTNAWTNPGNITSSDDAYATNATVGTAQGLRASNFGFAIPTNATILGVLAEIERHQSAASTSISTGAVYAGAGSNVAFGAGHAWSNPGRVTADDGSYASAVATGAGVIGSDYLIGTAFGFTIPTDATILGIKAEYKRYTDAAGFSYVVDLIAGLTKDGTSVAGSNKASGTAFPKGVGNVAYQSYGSAADLWGTTWTPAEVNASTFGFKFQAEWHIGTDTVTAFVDAMRITVQYQTADGHDVTVSLVNDASAVIGDNKAALTTAWPTTDAYATYGGAADTWGATLTPAMLNDADFGFLLSGYVPSTGRTLSVDHMRLTVTYQAGGVVDTVVRLVKAGSVVGSNYADTATEWPTSVPAYVAYGGLNDLWGTTWTAAQVVASTFGVVVSATVTNGEASVEHIRLTVAFTLQTNGNPVPMLAVITLDATRNTATTVVYQLPTNGQPTANDPTIDAHVSAGADFRTARRYDPSRAELKVYGQVDCYLDLDPTGVAIPGCQIQAQVDDSGTWIPLEDERGVSIHVTSGRKRLYFPGGLLTGRWCQLRVYIPAVSGTQAAMSATLRDIELSGYVIGTPNDTNVATMVLTPGVVYEDGQVEKRSPREMLDDLLAIIDPDALETLAKPVTVHDPVIGRDFRAVVTGQPRIQEHRFRANTQSSYVVTLPLARTRGGVR